MHVGEIQLSHIKRCDVCRRRISAVLQYGMKPSVVVRAYPTKDAPD